MLKQRILTALVLAPLALAAVFLLPPDPFAWVVTGLVGLAGWEWANLAGLRAGSARIAYGLCMAALMQFVLPLPAAPVLALGALFWLVALYWVVRFPGRTHWRGVRRRMLMGLFVLLPAGVALVAIKGQPAAHTLLLLLLLLVWGADIGAYFAGRRWGNAKLAPNVSPGKTRAGLWGGLACCVLIALVAGALLRLTAGQLVLLLFVALATGLASVLGDLLESMLKRHRGIKDSSSLLPGHGGVLDRIDSLTAAAPVFALGTISGGLGSLLGPV